MSICTNFDREFRFNSVDPSVKPLILRPLPVKDSSNSNKTFTYKNKTILTFFEQSYATSSQLLFSRDLTGDYVYGPFLDSPNLLISVNIQPQTPNKFRVKTGRCIYRLILGGRILEGANTQNIEKFYTTVPKSTFDPIPPRGSTNTIDSLVQQITLLYRGTANEWIDPNYVVYYFAEIDFKQRTFSIGKQGLNQKITIYNTTSILGDRFGKLYFTLFDKPNNIIPENSSMELAAKFVGADNPGSSKILRATVTCPGSNAADDDLKQFSSNNSAGSFGMFYRNADITINELNIAQRSQDDEFIVCSPAQKKFYINSSIPSTTDGPVTNDPLIQHISGVIDGVNKVYQQYDIEFLVGSFIGYTGLNVLNSTVNPWSYVPAVNFNTSFGYSWVRRNNNTCSCIPPDCGSGTLFAGCGILGAANNGWVTINSLELNIHTLAHELGHNFGAPHSSTPGLMYARWAGSNDIDAESDAKISQGIELRAGASATPAMSGYIPAVAQPTGLETVHSLRFDKNLPTGSALSPSGIIRVNHGENFTLEIDVTPLNIIGNPVNNTTEVHLAKQCRRVSGCYTWQIREGLTGDWKNILFRADTNNSKIISIPFYLTYPNTANYYRCIVNIGGVQATSNICMVMKKPTNSYLNVYYKYQTFTYTNPKPTYVSDLPESTLSKIISIVELSGTSTIKKLENICASYYSSIEKGSSVCMRTYGTGVLFESPKIYAIRSFSDYYTIEFPYIPSVGGGVSNSIPAPDPTGEVIYNYDSSWTYNVSQPIESFLMNKRMIVPITGILNIDNVQTITTQGENGDLLIWQNNDPVATLDVLEYDTMYTIYSTSGNVPFQLSFSLD